VGSSGWDLSAHLHASERYNHLKKNKKFLQSRPTLKYLNDGHSPDMLEPAMIPVQPLNITANTEKKVATSPVV